MIKKIQCNIAPYYQLFIHRHFMYLFGIIWVWFSCFTILKYIDIQSFYPFPQAARSMYAIDTAVNFTLWQYVCLEGVGKLWCAWIQPGKNRTLVHELTFSIVGIFFTLVAQHTVVLARMDSYAPDILHYFESYPSEKPAFAAINLFLFTTWGVAIVLRTVYAYLIITRQNEKENPELLIPPEGMDGKVSAGPDKKTIINLQAGKIKIRMNVDEIFHVKAEGHYCLFYLFKNDAVEKQMIHIPLRRVKENLPKDRFIQIHRSHIINLSAVKTLIRNSRSFQVVLKNNQLKLPVSRHRIQDILPLIEAQIAHQL